MKENSETMDRRRFLSLAAMAGAGALGGVLLSGCSSEGARSAASNSAPAENTESADIPSTAEDTSAPVADKTLVAVFSWSGHTLEMAEHIHERVGGDFFRIEPAEPYTTNYDEVLEVGQQQQDADFRPELAATVENWDEYGTVYLGYPVWWYHIPQIIKSFVDAHDLTGKTIIPFATSGGTSITGTLADIEQLCPNVQFSEGLTLDGDIVSSQMDRVDTWLEGLEQ